MDFTREPIVETVITPKEGFKLVVRSSKSVSQEEYFVDAVEVVSFGNAFFLRSIEKPKAFLVPASDYEVLEVREARIVLKNVGTDRSIKIGGGREGPAKPMKEPVENRTEAVQASTENFPVQPVEGEVPADGTESPKAEGRGKRDRRRNYRRRRGRDEEGREISSTSTSEPGSTEEQSVGEDNEGKIILTPPAAGIEDNAENIKVSSALLSSLLTPPPQLISETIERYKSNAMFKSAFYERADGELMGIPEMPDEETIEEPLSSLAWEFTPESESPTTTFSEEDQVQTTEDLLGAETAELDPEHSELPPENHRE